MTADRWEERWERRRPEALGTSRGRRASWLYGCIRTMIETGELRHSEELPSQALIAGQYGMSSTTSREAYGRLAMLGRVWTSQGELRRVHMPVEPQYRLVISQPEAAGDLRRAAKTPMASAVQLVSAAGAGPVTTRWMDGSHTVPEWEAEALGFDPGAELLTRVGVVSVGDERVLASISLVLPGILGPGVRCSEAEIGELALTGVSVTFDPANVRSRIPTLVEEEMLGMGALTPYSSVLAIYRPCRVKVEGDLRKWPGCVLVIARGDRVGMSF
jgi:DNA-binding transcriptional regulator YhcF (GntR family)